jgi:Ca2+/Na+ antiporter
MSVSSTRTPSETRSAMTTDQRGHRSRSVKPARPRDLRGLWRTILALIAPLPGLLMAAKIMASPFGIRADFAAVLSGVSGDPAREQLTLWLGLAFSLTVLPGVLAVAWASRRRSPWFALAGGVLSVIGFSVGFAVPDSSAAALVAVQQELHATKVAVINEVVSATTVVSVATVILLVASSTGLILLGVAQWRAGTGPRWLAALLGLSGAAHFLPAGTAVAAAAWLATGIGSVGASIGLLQSANDDFDLAPNGQQSAVQNAVASGNDARTVWRTLLAMAGPPLAVYVAISRFLLPYDMSDSPEMIFEKLVAHPGFGVATIWIGLVLAPTCIAGVVAVGWLSRRRVPTLTTTGLTLAVIGYTCLAVGNSFGELSTALVASHPEVDRATAYALGFGLELGPVSNLTGTLFVFGHLIGTTILGLALWRSRAVPSWAALLLAVSQPIHLASVLLDNRPLDLVGWGGTALGFAAAGWALLCMTNDDFDLPPDQAQA